MKPLEELTNVEKARLLHQLFPEEIPALLQYIEGVSQSIQERAPQERAAWTNGSFSFDCWLSLISDSQRSIRHYGNRLHSNSRLFADQLFDGYLAVYMVHCLTLYIRIRKHPRQKFVAAIDLLFAP